MMTELGNSASPKIIDFGLGKILGPTQTSTDSFGTLGYVAPEVLKKDPYSFPCDLWSLGCITFALISGTLPFDSGNPTETVQSTVNDPLYFEKSLWHNVSDLVKDFIAGLLIKSPEDRMTIEQAIDHPWLQKKHIT